MIRKRLAALVLAAGLGLLSGCSAAYSLGNPGGGGGSGLFGHCHARNGGSVLSGSPPCAAGFCEPGCPCDFPGGCDGCGSVMVPSAPYSLGDLSVMPQTSVPVVPPAGLPTSPPPGMPQFGSPMEPPLGNGTKFSPVPQAKTYPYSPAKY